MLTQTIDNIAADKPSCPKDRSNYTTYRRTTTMQINMHRSFLETGLEGVRQMPRAHDLLSLSSHFFFVCQNSTNEKKG